MACDNVVVGFNPPLKRGHFVQKERSVYRSNSVSTLMTPEEFANKLSYNDGFQFSGGKLINFEKVDRQVYYPPILMTNAVYLGFKKTNPARNCIVKNYWKKILDHQIKNVDSDVYGGTVFWNI